MSVPSLTHEMSQAGIGLSPNFGTMAQYFKSMTVDSGGPSGCSDYTVHLV